MYKLLDHTGKLQFESDDFDLVYGLFLQTPTSNKYKLAKNNLILNDADIRRIIDEQVQKLIDN